MLSTLARVGARRSVAAARLIAAPTARSFHSAATGNRARPVMSYVAAAVFAAGAVYAGSSLARPHGPIATVVAEEVATTDEAKKKKSGFKERKIVEYENRIRAFSNPERVFRYFATKEINGEVYMTANDFVRSLLPSSDIQPEGRGIDQFDKIDPSKANKYLRGHDAKSRNFIATLGDHGLFSYADYLFFLSVLTTPERQFELAFKMFDLDGNGTVDLKEFQQVQAVVRRQALGKRSRDKITMPSKSGDEGPQTIYSALLRHFFGADGLQKLTLQRFQTFIHELQTEILSKEYELNCSSPNVMTELDFAQVVLAYASLRDEEEYYERAQSRAGQDTIKFKQFLQFNSLLHNIDDLDTALGMFITAGASISKTDFKRAAKVAAGIDLDSHLIDVVFHLFDRDGDGELSYREFVYIMRRRAQRGMDKSRDLGVARGISGLMQCIKEKMKESKNR